MLEGFADTAAIKMVPSVFICTEIAATSPKPVMRQVPASRAGACAVERADEVPHYGRPGEEVERLSLTNAGDDRVVYRVAARDHAERRTYGRSRNPRMCTRVPGPVVFSPSPFADRVNAPPPPTSNGLLKPVAVNVLPMALNDCELAHTAPGSPPAVVQPPGDGVKPAKSTSADSAAPAPPMTRMTRKAKALADLIIKNSLPCSTR